MKCHIESRRCPLSGPSCYQGFLAGHVPLLYISRTFFLIQRSAVWWHNNCAVYWCLIPWIIVMEYKQLGRCGNFYLEFRKLLEFLQWASEESGKLSFLWQEMHMDEWEEKSLVGRKSYRKDDQGTSRWQKVWVLDNACAHGLILYSVLIELVLCLTSILIWKPSDIRTFLF